jgi:hypothetical protein
MPAASQPEMICSRATALRFGKLMSDRSTHRNWADWMDAHSGALSAVADADREDAIVKLLRQRAEMMILVCGGKMLPKEIADQIVDRTDSIPRRRRTRTRQFWTRATDDHPGKVRCRRGCLLFADGRGTAKVAPQLAGFSGVCRWTVMPPTKRSRHGQKDS